MMFKRKQHYYSSCWEAVGEDHKVLQFVVNHVLDGFYPENLFRGISFFFSLVSDSLEERVLKYFMCFWEFHAAENND